MTQTPELVTLFSLRPPLKVTGLRGTTPPVPIGGTGGWTLVPRPRRRSLTRWQGIDPIQIQLSIIFDGFPNTSVEHQIATLEQLAQPPSKRQQPPVVYLTGVVPHSELGYVIGDGQGGPGLAWDTDQTMRVYSELGYCVRAQCTVTLIEYVADDRVANQSAAARVRQQTAAQAASSASRAGGVPATRRVYTVRTGDTLFAIAARELGAASRWTEIAQLNGIPSPQSVAAGQEVKLP